MPDPTDVSFRLLRYFVAVAEELHFTRAAERLYVAQPALSKAIRRLETDLGLTLFARDRHGVALTAAGMSFLPLARGVLAEFDGWLAHARAAERDAARILTVGYHSSVPPEVLRPVIAEFTRLRPDWRIRLRLQSWVHPAAQVLDGTHPVAILRLPVADQDRLDMLLLRRDRMVVALPEDHRLAAREGIRMDDLADETFVAMPPGAGPLRDHMLLVRHFGGYPRIGAEVGNAEDYYQAVLTGQGVALLAESTGAANNRTGIAYRPMIDAPSSDLALVWAADSTDEVVRDLVRACQTAVRTAPATDAGSPAAVPDPVSGPARAAG